MKPTMKELGAKLADRIATFRKLDARCKAHKKGGTSLQRELRAEAYAAYVRVLDEGRGLYNGSQAWWDIVAEVTGKVGACRRRRTRRYATTLARLLPVTTIRNGLRYIPPTP